MSYPNDPNNDSQYRNKLIIEYHFNDQLKRCLQSVGTPFFSSSVDALLLLLPATSQKNIADRRDEWVPTVWDFEYMYAGPIRLGIVTDPLMMEDERPGSMHKKYPTPYVLDENGEPTEEIDWSDPHIRSPKLVENEVKNDMGLLQIILSEAENIGITWNIETYTEIRKTYPSKTVKNPTRRKQN